MHQQLFDSEESCRNKQPQDERNQVKPGMPIRTLVSCSASRLVLRISRVDLPSLSIGRASNNVFINCEDMPIKDLVRLIDNDPRFKLNLINMLSLQLEFGRTINSLGWTMDRIPIYTSQNARHLNLMAADEHSKAINRKLFWSEMNDLNRLSATIFLSKLVCEMLPSLMLVAKMEFEEGDEKRSCHTLGELLPITVLYMY